MKQNNFLGIIGGFFGALIGAIPFLLVYVFAGISLSVLTLPIAYLAYKGYTLLKGRVSDKTWLLIGIMSIFSITLITFLGIPLLLNIKNNTSILNLISFYQNQTLVRSLVGDYTLSLLFTILGTNFVISKLKEVNLLYNKEFDLNSNEVSKVINVFKNHEATSLKKAVSIKEIEAELQVLDSKNIITELKKEHILLGKNKLYLDTKKLETEEFETKILRKQSRRNIIIETITIIALVVAYFIISYGGTFKINKEDNTYKNYQFMSLASYNLPNYLFPYEEDFDEEYFDANKYYSVIYTPITTYRKEPVIRTIYVDYIPDYYYGDLEEYKKEVMKSNSDTYEISDVKLLDGYKYEVIEIKAKGDEDKIYYDYYVFNSKDSLFFEFIAYSNDNLENFSKETLKVIKSVEFQDNTKEEEKSKA